VLKTQFKLDGGEPESEANTFKDRYVRGRKRAKTPNLEVAVKDPLDGLVSKDFINTLKGGFKYTQNMKSTIELTKSNIEMKEKANTEIQPLRRCERSADFM